jgi:hypothetical protein
LPEVETFPGDRPIRLSKKEVFMRKMSFTLKSDTIYHFLLHATEEIFSFEPLPATRQVVTNSLVEAQALFPIQIYCAGACSGSLELLFSFTKSEKGNLRPFVEHLLETLEEEFRFFWSPVPEPLFRDMQILRCRNNEDAEQKLLEISCRPVEFGLVDRVEDWNGFSPYKQLAGLN